MAMSAAQMHPLPVLLLLLVVLLAGAPMRSVVVAQPSPNPSCGAQLSQLGPCARYSVPPMPGQALPAPGPECCSALGSVSRDCACGAIDIINSLPAKCGLPRVSCQ